MFKDLVKFSKADTLMWAGIAIFSLILIVAFSLMASNPGLVVKSLIGLVVVMILPGYTIVKLFFDHIQISDNMTKNPDINKALDKLIMSIGISVACIIPLNFVWNYLLTMGGGEGGAPDCAAGADCKPSGSNLWGNVDEELIYTGSASWRSLATVILVIGIAVGYRVFQYKRVGKA
ncbi:DUF1616 domain-containing protein [Methylolobus aquaticus]|uniref:DUF1616 domain-containing protein n=1 Tax=Methylotetracoccus oryzae TaxID=1919059 RepID=UPI00111B56B5|nr:DUF1616 domain-containing protein [Methylotetracoccus oryzae]